MAPQLTATNGPPRAASSRGWRAPPVPCRCPTRRAPAPAPCCAPPLDQRAHLLHRRRRADDALPAPCGGAAAGAARARRGATPAGRGRPARPACAPERRSHHGAELPQVDRLGQVVVGTGLERLDRVLGRAVGGDDDGLLAAGRRLRGGAAGPARCRRAGACR